MPSRTAGERRNDMISGSFDNNNNNDSSGMQLFPEIDYSNYGMVLVEREEPPKVLLYNNKNHRMNLETRKRLFSWGGSKKPSC
eukprot:scaffold2633_cov156-Amphora_coffeaeformis.AAC.4